MQTEDDLVGEIQVEHAELERTKNMVSRPREQIRALPRATG